MTQAEARRLRAGDYVLTRFGAARFDGFEKRTVAGVERDYLVLSYAGSRGAKLDRQYLPIQLADRIAYYH